MKHNNLSLEKRAALSTPLHYTLLPHHIPPRPHTALSENNVGRDWEGGKEGELEPRAPLKSPTRGYQGLRRVRRFAEFIEFRDQVVVPLEVSRFVEGSQGLDPPGAFTHIRGFLPSAL